MELQILKPKLHCESFTPYIVKCVNQHIAIINITQKMFSSFEIDKENSDTVVMIKIIIFIEH